MSSGIPGLVGASLGAEQKPMAMVTQSCAGRVCSGLKLPRGEWSKGFCAGLASGLFVQIIGYLSFLEVFLLVTFPLKFAQFLRTATLPGVRTFSGLWLLWVVGQIIADVVNQNDFGFAARGFAKSFFAGFVTLALLPSMLRRPRLFEAFLAGLPVAHLIGLKYFRSGNYLRADLKGWMSIEDMGWEYWIGPLAVLVLAYLVARFWRSCPVVCIVATFCFGGLEVAMGSRSTGLYHIVAASLMPLVVDVTRETEQSRAKRMRWQKGVPWGRFVLACGLMLAASVAVKDSYEHFASTGALGYKAYNKYHQQASEKYGNIVMGGRQGPFIGIAAAFDKPIIGHGSWARMDKDYTAAASDLFGVEFYREKNWNSHRIFIPSHSMIIAAWVEGGILGLIFWVYAMAYVARTLPRAILVFPEYSGVLLINSMGFFWSVLFSPIQTRNYTAMIMVPLLAASVLVRAQQRSHAKVSANGTALMPRAAVA